KLVTVNVLPVNEYPNIPSVVSQPGTIRPEGAVAADTVIATLKATDPDNTQPEIKITDPSGLFAVRKAGPNYEIYLKAGAVDFEALKAFDGQGWATVTTANGVKQVALKINAYSWDTQYASTSIPITFTVQDVDEAPSAPGVAMVRTSIDETVVAGGPLANFSAIDPEGGPLTFAIADDPDLADFLSVSGGSLTINANTTFNYEALKAMGASAWRTIDAGGIRRVGLRVIAVAKDAAQQSSGATEFWYYVNDVNEAPTAVSIVGGATSLSVSEDKIPGGAATIGTFTAGDPDGDALTYKLVDVNGAAVTDSFFALDPNNGVLTLKAAIDYETYTSRQIYVAASDGKLTSAPKLVTVNV
ncbi:Cadherin domain-containing protein, partial [Caulobacter sp. AP07]|uniref:cadherin repeat domain-containing protein n=1 Tax=Caulobacter sp. AP07 TaxID=1144304 RepID=UPI000271F805